MVFLDFWICGWTVGGVAATYQVSQSFDWFLIFCLGGWALCWALAAATLASRIAGSEIIRVTERDLETSVGLGICAGAGSIAATISET